MKWPWVFIAIILVLLLLTEFSWLGSGLIPFQEFSWWILGVMILGVFFAIMLRRRFTKK